MNNRYDFVYLFDVADGNPNGDPDAGNLPRVDPETGQGLVTDVCLKRKIRNYVELSKGGESPYHIYIKEKAILNQTHEAAYKALNIDADAKGSRKGSGDQVAQARQWMCQNFYDVRSFGAVMSTGINCGQVRGPVQLNFARSVSRVLSQEHAITRMAVATEKEAEKQGGDNRTMGRKFTVPYGLYRCHGYVSAKLAQQTGFGDEDLELLLEALENMFDHDRSAARGEMRAQALYVFKHDSELGNAPAHKLFELVKVVEKIAPPRSIDDYDISVKESAIPDGVTLIRRIEPATALQPA